MSLPLVDSRKFIQAIRDSGYKGTASAIAELVDNSLQAEASEVRIDIQDLKNNLDRDNLDRKVEVLDNGIGMRPKVLHLALQFGGSTRFNSRYGTGRYGMGLPSSSVSQARRVDVFTWSRPKAVWHSYLDIDEVSSGGLDTIPQPKRKPYTSILNGAKSPAGTLVCWTKCDRLSSPRLPTLIKNLHREIGRIFRYRIWEGKKILVNGELVQPLDPLLISPPNLLDDSAQLFGDVLKFPVSIHSKNQKRQRTSLITAKFSLLPVGSWAYLSNQDKRKFGVIKGAGVSILRSNREIDFGWFFMGKKRKENYDDWWRCEINFEPDLDEMFGVSHNKQGIHPTEALRAILSPDFEEIAHQLNNLIRQSFIKIKENENTAAKRAEAIDPSLPPPYSEPKILRPVHAPWISAKKSGIGGIRFKTINQDLKSDEFFRPSFKNNQLTISINTNHIFFEKLYGQLLRNDSIESNSVLYFLDTMLYAEARAETLLYDPKERETVARIRIMWGTVLEAFLL